MQLSAGGARLSSGHLLTAALLVLAGCTHGEALDFNAPTNQNPFNPSPPIRLTYSPDPDQYASWRADGRGILYSFVPVGSSSFDHCIGELPSTGGQMRASRCSGTDRLDDSTDALTDATSGPSGKFAWVEQHNLRRRLVPDYGSIRVGTLDQRVASTTLLTLPYTASSGSVHATAINLRWLSASQLAYIGADVIVRALCNGCKPDTLVIAKEVVLLSSSGGAPTLLPNSAETTSIWPTPDGTSLYYTVAGDSRVFLRQLNGGTPEVVHDFAAGGIARDVSVVGNRLAAIVGGNVSYGSEAVTGARQIDSGGLLMIVNLTTGDEAQQAITETLFRRPALSPDGASVVAEGIGPGSLSSDLWLFALQ